MYRLLLLLLILVSPAYAYARPIRFVQKMGGLQLTSPKQLSGLRYWLDAADAASITVATGVSQANDKSGNGFTVTQGTGSLQPAYASTTLNNKNTITFDSADDFLTFAVSPNTVMNSAQAGHIFLVIRKAADPASSQPASAFLMGGATSGAVGVWGTDFTAGDHNPWTDGQLYMGWGSNVRKSPVDPVVSLATWHLYEIQTAAGLYNQLINRSSIASTGTNTVAWNTLTAYLGFSAGTPRYYHGDVAEIIIYNRILNSTEQRQIYNYIASKWGV